MIDLYPEDQTPDPLAQERMAHEAHAKNKLFACIDRPAHLAALNAFAAPADHGGKGLVVTGESGGGKTALLAAWARDWAKNHPEDFLFQHYFGATPDSASPDGFLRRLLGELKSRFGITDDIPTDPDKLREALPLWLAQTTRARGAESSSCSTASTRCRAASPTAACASCRGTFRRTSRCSPPRFPARRSTPCANAAGRNTTCRAPAKPRWTPWSASTSDNPGAMSIRRLPSQTAAAGNWSPPPARRTRSSCAPCSRNCASSAASSDCPQRVRHYLEADNPKDLFLRVLTRWQEDFDGKDPEQDKPKLDLVRRALTHLWAARQGLSEPEWLDLLGMTPPSEFAIRIRNSSPLPRAFWTPLFLALEPHLSQRAGLFAFGHDFLRQAVEAAFVPSDDSQQAAHLSVADYFERHPHAAGNDPAQGRRMAVPTPRRRGLGTSRSLPHRHPALPRPLQRQDEVGTDRLLASAARAGPRHGRLLHRSLCAMERRSRPAPATITCPRKLGQFLRDNGLYPAAEPLLRRALEARERVLGPEHPDTLTSVNNLAELLESKGDYAGAQPLYGRALEARERVLGPEHPDTLASVNNLAALLESKGDYAGAEPLYERALEASERVLGPEHPDTLASVNNLAGLLYEQRRLRGGAAACIERALEASERVLGPEHPDTLASVNNLAGLLYEQRRLRGGAAACMSGRWRPASGCWGRSIPPR